MNLPQKNGEQTRCPSTWLLHLGLYALVLTVLFFRGWLPGWVIFSNDGPLGQQNAAYLAPWPALTGMWADLNWIGTNGGIRAPGISWLLGLVLGPVGYSKFLAPFSLLLLGMCARYFFRRLEFSQLTCFLGGLAALLNGDFVATACWGVAPQIICFAMCFVAMGLVANLNDRPWLRTILAGFAVGIGVVEASDIGAIFSVFVAAWVMVHAWIQTGTIVQRLGLGCLRLALLAGCAAVIASIALVFLFKVQIKGVVGMAQDEQTKAMRWGEATQWSVPKRESLGVMVPGFFGFRMDTPMFLPEYMQKAHASGAYWGFVGRDAAWEGYLKSDRSGPVPQGFLRYGGGSGYAGILVLLVAAWALVQSFRGENSFFTAAQRRMLWFWLAVMVLATGMMFGRFAPKFAPLYEIFYALPGASMIRNPAKFIHVLEWALIVVFGYGLHGLTTLYLERASATTKGVVEQFSIWWKQARGFDKNWVRSTFIALAIGLAAWFVYYGLRGKVEAYVADLNQCATLQQGGRPDPVAAANSAAATIGFSLKQVGWAVFFLAASVGTLAVLVSGGFAGKRARAAGIILGLLVVIDLGWQARPWIIAQNWTGRYVEAAKNPVFNFLRDKPYEHRVGGSDLNPRIAEWEGPFQSFYGSEWTQHLFPYYNIQSISVIQMPRRPLDYDVFEATTRPFDNSVLHLIARRWELTNTRYIACAAPLVNAFNQIDQNRQRFKIKMQFDFRTSEPPLIHTNENGRFALIEFTGALPRAKLYSDWQVAPYETNRITEWLGKFPPGWGATFESLSTNDLATLELLTRASFDPAQTVLLAAPIKAQPATNAAPGSVDYVSYTPKEIVLKTKSTAANVLLLNDRYDPNWQVTIDGKPAELLRCNYLMRGVEVPAGEHQVEFHFRPDTKYLYVSLAAIVLGLGLIGYLAVPRRGPIKAD